MVEGNSLNTLAADALVEILRLCGRFVSEAATSLRMTGE
jgi:hypothetical protein